MTKLIISAKAYRKELIYKGILGIIYNNSRFTDTLYYIFDWKLSQHELFLLLIKYPFF